MRVLITTPLSPPEPGGPATYTKLVEDSLPAYGIEVSVLKFSDVRKYPNGIRHVIYFLKVLKKGRNVDMLYAQDTVSVGWPTLFANCFLRKKFVVRVPGDHIWEQGTQRFGMQGTLDNVQRFSFRWHPYLFFLRILQQLVVRYADRIIVPSQYFKSIVRTWGVPENKIGVIYHGFHDELTMHEPKSMPGRPFMVSIGRLVPWKGFAFLIQLLPQLPEWKLVIVGSGPDRTKLEEAAQAAGITDRVLFTGGVPRAEAVDWCASADVFVLDTSFESFSFQVLEAMALGARVITTNIGSLPELITDGKEGVLLKPDDADGFVTAIRSVQTEPSAWEQRREAARQRAREFSVGRMLDETAKQLLSII